MVQLQDGRQLQRAAQAEYLAKAEAATLSASTAATIRTADRRGALAASRTGWKRSQSLPVSPQHSALWPADGLPPLPQRQDLCHSASERGWTVPLSGECR